MARRHPCKTTSRCYRNILSQTFWVQRSAGPPETTMTTPDLFINKRGINAPYIKATFRFPHIVQQWRWAHFPIWRLRGVQSCISPPVATNNGLPGPIDASTKSCGPPSREEPWSGDLAVAHFLVRFAAICTSLRESTCHACVGLPLLPSLGCWCRFGGREKEGDGKGIEEEGKGKGEKRRNHNSTTENMSASETVVRFSLKCKADGRFEKNLWTGKIAR